MPRLVAARVLHHHGAPIPRRGSQRTTLHRPEPSRAEEISHLAAADGRRATTAAPQRARARAAHTAVAGHPITEAGIGGGARSWPVLISCGDRCFGSLARELRRRGMAAGVVWLAGGRGRPIPGHAAGDTARSTWRGAVARVPRVAGTQRKL